MTNEMKDIKQQLFDIVGTRGLDIPTQLQILQTRIDLERLQHEVEHMDAFSEVQEKHLDLHREQVRIAADYESRNEAEQKFVSFLRHLVAVGDTKGSAFAVLEARELLKKIEDSGSGV